MPILAVLRTKNHAVLSPKKKIRGRLSGQRSGSKRARTMMTKRRRFNQTSILKKLNAKCERCGIPARSKDANLTIHHRNHKSDDTDWKNIMIYCTKCHSIVEGTDRKKRDRR